MRPVILGSAFKVQKKGRDKFLSSRTKIVYYTTVINDPEAEIGNYGNILLIGFCLEYLIFLVKTNQSYHSDNVIDVLKWFHKILQIFVIIYSKCDDMLSLNRAGTFRM